MLGGRVLSFVIIALKKRRKKRTSKLLPIKSWSLYDFIVTWAVFCPLRKKKNIYFLRKWN